MQVPHTCLSLKLLVGSPLTRSLDMSLFIVFMLMCTILLCQSIEQSETALRHLGVSSLESIILDLYTFLCLLPSRTRFQVTEFVTLHSFSVKERCFHYHILEICSIDYVVGHSHNIRSQLHEYPLIQPFQFPKFPHFFHYQRQRFLL